MRHMICCKGKPMALTKVLVVDDDDLICWALKKEFASVALPARFVGNARDALTELRDDSYDLIFLDIHLPDGNGIELLDEIKKVSPETRIVIVSADAKEDNWRRAVAGGAIRFIEKPFDMSEIHNALRSAAGDYSLKRKHPRYICRIPVRLSIVTPVPGKLGFDLHNLSGLMGEVGAGGVAIRTDYPLRVGQNIRVHMVSPGDAFSKFLPPHGMAEVVWVTPQDRDVTAGLRFLP